MIVCGVYDHHNYQENNVCARCGNYDFEDDEELEDFEDEDDDLVYKIWNGRANGIEIDKTRLDRAIALIHEHKIYVAEEAYKIVLILEEETGSRPFDREIANTVVVALREVAAEAEKTKPEMMDRPHAQGEKFIDGLGFEVDINTVLQDEHENRQRTCFQGKNHDYRTFRTATNPKIEYSCCARCRLTETPADFEKANRQ